MEEEQDEYNDEYVKDEFEEIEDENEIDYPERQNISIYKYQVEPDVPRAQQPELDPYRPFYGRHVALGNVERFDIIRFLDTYDVVTMLEECPTLRQRGTNMKGRLLTELQLLRSNKGFERRMETTVTKQSAIDIQDNRFNLDYEQPKKKRFKLFRRKNK